MTDVGDRDPVIVPLLAGDVHDVPGLARIRQFLFAA
jgi:hypothetical protein